MLRLLKQPNLAPDDGWGEVLTPLGGSAHAQINSPAWELCEEWRTQNSGRWETPTREKTYYWYAGLLSNAPSGLVAELLWTASCELEFAVLLRRCPTTRRHVLDLPHSLFGADEAEVLELGAAVELATVIAVHASGMVAVLETLASVGEWCGVKSRLECDAELRRAVTDLWTDSCNPDLANVAAMAAALCEMRPEIQPSLSALKDLASAGDVIAVERMLLASPALQHEAVHQLTREPQRNLSAVGHLAFALIGTKGNPT